MDGCIVLDLNPNKEGLNNNVLFMGLFNTQSYSKDARSVSP